MKIFKEKAGVISKGPVWVVINKGYLYIHDTLIGVMWLMITEWEHDKHLVG